MISKLTNVYVYKSILYTPLSSYMFRPLMWPSSGRCITKYRYIEILQKFSTKAHVVKYYKIQMKEYKVVCRTANINTPLLGW